MKSSIWICFQKRGLKFHWKRSENLGLLSDEIVPVCCDWLEHESWRRGPGLIAAKEH